MSDSATTHSDTISVFISHRHVDKELADVFREEITDWCLEHAQIYQSSSAQNASKIGTRLDLEIAKAISESNLVLLIYTDAPGDYDWCMYECGLAQDPERLESNIAVFYTTEDLPDPLDNRVGLRLERSSIEKFVVDFHRAAEFFAEHPEPYRPDVSDDYVARQSKRLYERLKEVAPKNVADVTVYDRITFGLDDVEVDKIIQAADEDGFKKAVELALEIVPAKTVVRSFSGDPQEHFNYDTFEETMSLGSLAARWRQDSDDTANGDWEKELCMAISAAALNRPERSLSTPFQSLASSQWLLPLLARFRIIPYEDVYEFDVLFCKLDANVAQRMVDR